MPDRAEWRIRTRFREVVLRPAGSPIIKARDGAASLLTDLRFELETRNPDVTRVLAEMKDALAGLGFPARAGEAGAEAALDALAQAVHAGEVVLEQTTIPGISAGVEPTAAQGEPEPDEQREPTFIEIEVRDADDRPVRDRRVRIELHTGEVHTRYVSLDGKVRIDGIESDGVATVSVLPPEGGSPGGPPKNVEEPVEPKLIELVFVGADGKPLAGMEAELRFDDGRTERLTTDAGGLAKLEVEDLPASVELAVESIATA